jgi:hypothetical protein
MTAAEERAKVILFLRSGADFWREAAKTKSGSKIQEEFCKQKATLMEELAKDIENGEHLEGSVAVGDPSLS